MSYRAPHQSLVRLPAIAIAASLIVTGCNDKALRTDAVADAGDHRTSSSLTPEQSAKVLARIGDRTITLGDYVSTLEHMDQFDRLRYQSPERRKELLQEMIDIELLAREATVRGYDQDPLAQQEERSILRESLLADARKGAVSPNDLSDQDVRAYYDAHRADYRDPERRRVSAIVLKTEAAANNVLELAKKTNTASGWGELVRSRSINPQAKGNVPVDLAGDMGMVSPPGDPRGENARIPEPVRVAVFALAKVGDISPAPVKTDDGFYLVRLTQKTDAHDRAFTEAERSIRVKMAQDKVQARETDLLTSLRAQYPVKVDEAVLARVNLDLADGGGAAMPVPSASVTGSHP